MVILDDCLSAVDAKTEKIIFENLDRALQNKTVIFITHRIFAVTGFDKIIVLEDGRIAEQGTYAELMKKQGVYYELYKLQLQENNT